MHDLISHSTSKGGRYYYSLFTNEETEAQGGHELVEDYMTCKLS